MGKATLADSGQEVGFFSHFLRELKLTDGSPGKRAATFNRILEKAGSEDMVEQQEVENHAGQWPYAASKEVFAIILKHL